MISAIIVSNAKNKALIDMTQNAIDTVRVDEVIVMEQTDHIYKRAKTIKNTMKVFNYNETLNLGITHCKGEHIALCNNDIYFFPGFKEIANIMKRNGIHSASPYILNETKSYKLGNHTYMGHGVTNELKGCCIILDRFTIEKIGTLDTSHNFWYSDNAYADQLIAKGIDHHLVCNIIIEHLGSKTIKTERPSVIRQFTYHEGQKYRKCQQARRKLN